MGWGQAADAVTAAQSTQDHRHTHTRPHRHRHTHTYTGTHTGTHGHTRTQALMHTHMHSTLTPSLGNTTKMEPASQRRTAGATPTTSCLSLLRLRAFATPPATMGNTQTTEVPAAQQILQTVMDREQVDRAAQEYLDFFQENDRTHDKKVDERKTNYAKMVNYYYDLATDFYEYGWGQSFHFAPRYQGESFEQSIARHEHHLALKMKLEKGQRVLDVGCGVGGPLREIARFSNAHVTGLNNNAYQIQRAQLHTTRLHLESLCSYVKGDFMKMPIEDNTFDAVYQIEATCHAPNKVGVYSEIFRVMKPGAVFGGYEWIMTDKYDATNEIHRRIKLGIEEGDGLPDMTKSDDVLAALKTVGFEILEFYDMAPESPVPWYQPLAGSLSLTGFRHTQMGRWCTHKMCQALEYTRIAPNGTVKISNMLMNAADALVEGGRLDIFTPMFFVMVRKPLDAK